MSERALQMYENATNKMPSNEEVSKKMQLLNEKRELLIELDKKNALLENEKTSTIYFKKLANKKKEELNHADATIQGLRSDLNHANTTIQELRSDLNQANTRIQELRSETESLNNNQQVTKINNKNKQRTTPCPHGNKRSARCRIPPCTGSAFCVHKKKKNKCKECKAAIQAAAMMSLMSTGSDTNFNSLGSNPLPLTNNRLSINESIFTASTQNSQDINNFNLSPFDSAIN